MVSPGTYELIVTDEQSGCTDSATVTIDENPDAPIIETTNTSPLTCINELVILDGSGTTGGSNLEYEWQDEDGNTISI